MIAYAFTAVLIVLAIAMLAIVGLSRFAEWAIGGAAETIERVNARKAAKAEAVKAEE